MSLSSWIPRTGIKGSRIVLQTGDSTAADCLDLMDDRDSFKVAKAMNQAFLDGYLYAHEEQYDAERAHDGD